MLWSSSVCGKVGFSNLRRPDARLPSTIHQQQSQRAREDKCRRCRLQNGRHGQSTGADAEIVPQHGIVCITTRRPNPVVQPNPVCDSQYAGVGLVGAFDGAGLAPQGVQPQGHPFVGAAIDVELQPVHQQVLLIGFDFPEHHVGRPRT